MNVIKTPRPYQESALTALWNYLHNHKGHPLLDMPVGAGKSLTIAEFIRRTQQAYARTRIVVLAHVKELLQQNAEELREQYPEADYGFYCASLGQKRLHNDITFASIQSIHNKIDRFNRAPQLIIIDECHLISHKDSTTYRKFIDAVLSINPKARVIGFTGTPYRADTGRLDEGEGKLFDEIIYSLDIGWMVKEGFLCKPVVPKVKTELSTEGVSVRGGDFVEKQLQKAVNTDDNNERCVNEIIEHGASRKKWLIFTAGIQHCESVRDLLREKGISAEMITGETPKEERDKIIADFKASKFKALVNVAVLTTGFNAPDIDMLAFMRPTRSPVLYIQCMGRGIRTAPDKKDCLVLDFGNIIGTLGAIDQVSVDKIYRKKDTESEPSKAAIKMCPECGAECAAAQRYCYECSYDFAAASLAEQADKHNAILSEDMEPERYEVLNVQYKKHEKKNSPDSPCTMRVIYTTLAAQISEWVCFDHAGYARDKAVNWSKKMLPDYDVPLSVDDALSLDWPKPSHIWAKKEGKYWRVTDYEFKEKPEKDENKFDIVW